MDTVNNDANFQPNNLLQQCDSFAIGGINWGRSRMSTETQVSSVHRTESGLHSTRPLYLFMADNNNQEIRRMFRVERYRLLQFLTNALPYGGDSNEVCLLSTATEKSIM